jgi:hypothetical protein
MMLAENTSSLFTVRMVEGPGETAEKCKKSIRFRWRNQVVDRCVAVGSDAQRMAPLISSATTEPAICLCLFHGRAELA